jgi:hypothetical protein
VNVKDCCLFATLWTLSEEDTKKVADLVNIHSSKNGGLTQESGVNSITRSLIEPRNCWKPGSGKSWTPAISMFGEMMIRFDRYLRPVLSHSQYR